MIPLSIKLKKDFDLVYRKGRLIQGDFFSLRFLGGLSGTPKPTRFGIIISTKISKKAVERNRKRRQLKEIARLNRSRVVPGALVIITLKEKGLGAEYGDLESEFLRLMTKAGLMVPKL